MIFPLYRKTFLRTHAWQLPLPEHRRASTALSIAKKAQKTDAGTFESLLRANNLVAESGANKVGGEPGVSVAAVGALPAFMDPSDGGVT